MLILRISSASGSSRYFGWPCEPGPQSAVVSPFQTGNSFASMLNSSENPRLLSLFITFHENVDDLKDILFRQRVEYDHIIDTVQELWAESAFECFFDHGAIVLILAFLAGTCAKPTPSPKSFSWRAPMLDVMMINVFLKSLFVQAHPLVARRREPGGGY